MKPQKKQGYVYLLKSLDLYKIGRTQCPASRFSVYSTENPHGLKLLVCGAVPNSVAFERSLHEWYEHKRVIGEWFRFSKEEVRKVIFDIELESTPVDACYSNIFSEV